MDLDSMHSLSIVLLAGLAVMTLVPGCRGGFLGQPPGVWTADNRAIPHGLGKHLPIESVADSSPLLRYDALYVSDYETADGRHYEWLRFWPNGRVLAGDPVKDELPTAASGEDFSWGTVGRYVIDGNRIYMEFWEPGYGSIGRMFVVSTGQVSEDGDIVVTKRHVPRQRFHPASIEMISGRYKVLPVGPMQRKPDW